ncbi:putative swim zinc finger protein [Phaeoacremonium minimum UCRPA7]|uniref:Putative swim zinc finger protein n=1 Tax=Phaeoacremonium minimum (strain UCR-PA7) TaxID=1286976 RepID=R8BG14_PHAM7|nr:putative swim zinc finger protein [Phaeoacremonium minimum UCRPA7]EON98227.1 putative swim zinc finger protein [Phaeoacremonium minimum UCRPA7]
MGITSDHQSASPGSALSHSHKRKRDVTYETTTYNAPSHRHPSTPSNQRIPLIIDLDGGDDDDDGEEIQYLGEQPKKKPRTPAATGTPSEKRLRRYRARPPQSFDDTYLRATTQRFYVLSRTRCGTATCPEEMIELTGSTGNIYNICIARQPTCDCPHASAGNQCKHVIYVMSRVLRARHEYVYQLALLSTELQDIFARAPLPMDECSSDPTASSDKNRKPVEGDCPICFNELDPAKEAVVWCRAACGQNIHKECFAMWAATKRQNTGRNGEITCPFCRSVWQGDEDTVQKIKKTGPLNDEGYVNVADQLGISQERGRLGCCPTQ